MNTIMVHVGLGCYVNASQTMALIQPGSSTARRRVALAKKLHQFIDCTHGKGCKSLVLMSDNTVVASHLLPSTVAKRFANPFNVKDDGDLPTKLKRHYGDPMVTSISYTDDEDTGSYDDVVFDDVEDAEEEEEIENEDEDDSDPD